ncbi:GntR family transcriptional regulator (plasmid) [Streptomyces sp. NBC_00053]|uniref:GntR family transcriptional regulator n=1 Tax=unclassified Streptomyces TaxID=2593676 RepID=UPI002251F782|nr:MULTISPECIES: GntR family transcriptional regulator [unclassified Streptomyces]MCX4399993.1 GntR family transcriptional regulator [Streptomyces sp. NBC_01767]MCX5106897.1 GntR family transcriptional regulator [Streptomyces sp. NBC_00439]MCX5506004.1 GntR family transcriptional regulator [Streptomyces sp. NBC_00052]MCX5554341.1 GntR family transcriptional regulator [Streptomyces sp. NBC_00051]
MTGGTSKQPKYRQIADTLRAAIDAGEYQPGDRLPGENPLAAEHDVAVMTARQALNALKTEGLVESRKGAGFFVRSFRPIRRRSISRLAREQWKSGVSIFSADDERSLTAETELLGVITAPEPISRVLNLDADAEVFARFRRHIVDGRPVLLSTSYLPNDLVAGSRITQNDTGPGGIYARLAELGAEPNHFREELRVRTPSAEDAKRLHLAVDTPVIKICRTAYTAQGRAVEVNEMTLDSAAYVLEYDFPA